MGVEDGVAVLPPLLAIVVEVAGAVPLVWYIFNRFGPPQYSVEFPPQVISHWVTVGSDPATRAEPGFNVLPQ